MGDLKSYEWYKSHGICVCCKKEDVAIGYVKCPECILKANEEYHALSFEAKRERVHRNIIREKKIHEKGLCSKCGKPVCERSKWFCEEHRLARNRQVREYRNANKIHKSINEIQLMQQTKLLAMREGYRRYQLTERAKVNNAQYKKIGQDSLLRAFAKQG